MINNITDMLLNMTNTTTAPSATNSVDHGSLPVVLGIAAFWGLLIVACEGYKAGRCNPCGLFRADTTTPIAINTAADCETPIMKQAESFSEF